MRPARPIIAITMGDFNGIGPEIAVLAACSRRVRKVCTPVLIGRTAVFERAAATTGGSTAFREISAPAGCTNSRSVPVLSVPGERRAERLTRRPAAAAGVLAARSIALAVRLSLAGEIEGFVTAPLSKQSFRLAGSTVPGQTEYIARLCRRPSYAMMLVAGKFRVGLATIHLPLRRVAASLTQALLVDRLGVLFRSLKHDFSIRRPVIALLGLNPHAGDGGLLGSEEQTVILPAMHRARAAGIRVTGPFPADGFFGMHAERGYDAVLAMYHDQGLIPLKMAGFRVGVNYTAGLPVVRTSPDHGTAYEIAGRGEADPSSIIEAVLLAASIARSRRRF